MGNLSVHGTSTPKVAEQQAVAPTRQQPFSDDDFLKAWDEYARENPTEKIVANAMATCRPSRVGENHYSIRTLSLIQQQQMTDAKPAILQFIADRLNNDLITLDVDIIASDDEAPPSTWRPAKVLDRMKKDNPYMGTFINDFDLKPE